MDEKEIITVSFANGIEDLDAMLNLDYDTYPIEGLVERQTIIDRFEKDNYQYIVAKKQNNLMGYLNIVSVPERIYKRILEGKWIESEDLIGDNILPLRPETNINCYITSIVARNHDTEVAAQLLIAVFEKYAKELAKQRIKIDNIIAISFSPDGESLCKKLEFEHITDIEEITGGFVPSVYRLNLRKPSNRFLVKKVQKILNIELGKAEEVK